MLKHFEIPGYFRRSRRPDQAGLTLIEMMVAIVASSIVVMSLGRLVTTNQTMVFGGRSRAVLKQDVSRVLNVITQDVRESRWVMAQSAAEFRTYDTAGAVTHVYLLTAVDGDNLVTRDGMALAQNACDNLAVAASPDSTILTVSLGLSDDRQNATAGFTAVSVRNHAMEF